MKINFIEQSVIGSLLTVYDFLIYEIDRNALEIFQGQ